MGPARSEAKTLALGGTTTVQVALDRRLPVYAYRRRDRFRQAVSAT